MPDPVNLLRAQYAVARSLAESGSLAEAAPSILREVCGALGWDVGVLWRVDPVDRVLRFVDFWSCAGLKSGDFESECRTRTFEPGLGLPGRVWKEGKPSWIPDVSRDANFPRAPFAQEPGLKAAFAFPVRLREQILGVLEFFRRDESAPDDDLLSAMEAAGAQIGQYDVRRRAEGELAEANARLAQQNVALEDANRRLADLAVTDALTGISNHRAFRQRLDAFVSEAARGRSFALVMVDVDHFKRVNDIHGHPAGDQVLRGVAETLRDGIRKTDFAARYGGEEFAVLLADVEEEQAAEISEILRKRVGGLASPFGRVTASFGVAMSRIGRNSAEALLAAADGALLKAKKRGRNRVERAAPPKVKPAISLRKRGKMSKRRPAAKPRSRARRRR
ncbi:MAG: diguanylate cyclase with PAS/PAC and GAF [Planctomycetota bacterium]|nr:MAG: diguanylate cyclase with PAS/PAC and GAF [Planctomycetota bacterium]